MTGSEKRAWIYAISWVGGGVAAGAGIWELVNILTSNVWTTSTQGQRIDVLGSIANGLLVIMGLTTLGLTLRNAIRNIKGSVGPVNFEASRDREGT